MQLLDSSVLTDISYYIDPGTGSLIIQVAIASAISGLFMLKLFWGRVKLFVGKLLGRHQEEDK